MPADAAIVAEGVLATVQRTLQHNTVFDGAPSEVFGFRTLNLKINFVSGFKVCVTSATRQAAMTAFKE